MTDPRHPAVATLLDQIEQEMRQLDLWTGQPPEAAAFSSTTPFFADCMGFEQWLQWVLVARFRALIDGALPLPSRCQIAPMAEESLRHLQYDLSLLFALLHELDALFESPGP
jgi:uncharacterized protein YqcC (DUF446 family)